ncbi:MAG TPA: hypothetical protein DEA08_02375 [Planctomycetes bacterium]|nr:hypothetical protein [Planctomycetota bacterium]
MLSRFAAPALALVTLLGGCAAPQKGADPAAPQRVSAQELQPAPESVAPAPRAAGTLKLLRRNDALETLYVEVTLLDRARQPVARASGSPPEPQQLAPGVYHALVRAGAHRYGFEVRVRAGQSVDVLIQSRPDAELVSVETRTPREGYVLVERQTLGYRWGPVPLPGITTPAPQHRRLPPDAPRPRESRVF